ncbi:MAG: preprotein translocase subunit YajC [Rhodospirillaceae bacterium]|jgi:preprotein translocase subunit YajC|nr:preprotein translocase subunit YajC [Rhodospirillaceae bacterium]
MFISEAWAQAAGGAAGGTDMLVSLAPMVLIFIVFWFLLIRPQQKKAKEHRAMVAALKRGDRIVTNGGIFGQVSHVADDHLMVEIAEGVKIKIARDAVAAIPSKPEPVKKDEAKGANDR